MGRVRDAEEEPECMKTGLFLPFHVACEFCHYYVFNFSKTPSGE